MHLVSLLIALTLLGAAHDACKVICEDCMDCCDKFHGEAYLSGEGHSLSYRRKRRAAGREEDAGRGGELLPRELVRISGAALLRLCDGDEDGEVAWAEYELCSAGLASPRTMARKFDTLDTNRDRTLSAEEMRPVSIKMMGASDCYDALVTSCASQFVVYERSRSVSTQNFCHGFQFYSVCVSQGAAFCSDSRTRHLVETLASAAPWLQQTCADDGFHSNSDRTSRHHMTSQCAVRLMHDLHGSVAPCRAMANFRQCLHTAAPARTNGQLPFTEVTDKVVC